ncbi:uncharacterized protein LOC132131734 [Carassius carassius]|uniref:uncharacterized protein LOC132131734 n=1 Tax=Carassius carassius TaxID=217509 RepID=UPI002869319B|nr:uncharacterized protein LOC132131734 [Carassius carassius]
MLLQYLFLMFLDGAFGAETDETVSVMEGDSITLHTNLTEVLNDDTILWLFGPKDSIISQITRKTDLTSFYVTEDERFRGRLQVDQQTGTLTIRKTRIKHTGQYKLSFSRRQTTIKIFHVAVIDVVGETDGVKSVSVMEGDSVTLQYDVSEVQRDDLIVWRFGDKGLLLAKIDVESNNTSLNDADERFRDRLKLSESRSLTIKNTRTTDSGLYEVQIRGSESSQRFLLSVSAIPDSAQSTGFTAGIVLAILLAAAVVAAVVIHYRRKISDLEKQMGPIEVSDGDFVTLETKTVLNKDDKVQWYYHDDSDLIAEISRGTKGTFDGFDERFRSKLVLDYETGNLTINNTMNIHSGLYILKISSKTRKINRRFTVTVKMRKVLVEKGGSISLEPGTDIQGADEILWTFGAENCLVVKADPEITIGKRFTDRLELNERTGSLIIRNIETADSGHFKLQIINSEKTTFRRYNVSVTKSTGKQVNGSAAVEMPLL